ncbi:MAG: hypothetical protein LBU11_12510 [Zoogloeaceae bacterium]|jgi:hypothetical protein|nr:hypothetical protein [Zoogloeaceae bacterium]
MSNFVRVTNTAQEKTLFVNLDATRWMEACDGATLICFDGEHALLVKETPGEILARQRPRRSQRAVNYNLAS